MSEINVTEINVDNVDVGTKIVFPDETVQTTASSQGRILQVVHVDTTDNTSANTTTDVVDITELEVAITPSATTTKILIVASISWGGATNNNVAMGFRKDIGGGGYNRIGDSANGGANSTRNGIIGVWNAGVHNPNITEYRYMHVSGTTSELTYRPWFQNRTGYAEFYLNRPSLITADHAVYGRSSMTLYEIAV